jgi:uncharacterized protein YjiS (DUF1127 family)
MKSMTFDATDAAGMADVAGAAEASPSGLARIFGMARAAVAEHLQRRQLAGLDNATLRDLGVEPDEIGRIRAGDDFVPRAWK